MILSTFAEKIAAHPKLHPGTGPRDDRVYIIFDGPDQTRLGWELELDTIRETPWEQIEAVLTGARRPDVMSHISRIVGYYSNMRNWNGSKLAEARDRARGNYAVSEPTTERSSA